LIAGHPTEEYLALTTDLHTVLIPWAELPPSTRTLLRDFPNVRLHNIHHNAIPAAEMAMTLLLSATKKVVPADRGLRVHDWSIRYGDHPLLIPTLLHGKRVLILGLGAIGSRVATICQALGMEVHATRRTVNSTTKSTAQAQNISFHGITEINTFLPSMQVVVVPLPQSSSMLGVLILSMRKHYSMR
jgi:phosphoglycerate dehydrogenase-like enzyme